VIEGHAFLDIGQDLHHPTHVIADRLAADGPLGLDHARRQDLVSGLVIVQGHTELRQLVLAGTLPGRFPGRLDRRQEQRDQDADDGNHHQQFHQGKAQPSFIFHRQSPFWSAATCRRFSALFVA
jgi:hypothetical protein